MPDPKYDWAIVPVNRKRLLEFVAIEPTSNPLFVKVLPATLSTKLDRFNVPELIVTFPEAVAVPSKLLVLALVNASNA